MPVESIELFACWVFFILLLSSADFFFKINSFRNTIIMSNGLDPDQDRCYVGPDLGPKSLRRLLAGDKCRRRHCIVSLSKTH